MPARGSARADAIRRAHLAKAARDAARQHRETLIESALADFYQATAIADVAGARMRHLDETGVYCHVIADGGMSKGGDIAKAVACGADAVMLGSPLSSAVEAPARGFHWGMATFHPTLPRGARVKTTTRGTLQEILLGPAHENDGRMNLFGALRTAMATCGYETVKEFQKAEVMVAPALQTEGKDLQRSQGVGMGH